MADRYETKKIMEAEIRANTNGVNKGEQSGPGFHWIVREVATGIQIGEPYSQQADAENACSKLNFPRS